MTAVGMEILPLLSDFISDFKFFLKHGDFSLFPQFSGSNHG